MSAVTLMRPHDGCRAHRLSQTSPRLFDASPLHEIAFWNSIQLTSQSEKSCQMAVPPSRALLVAELPVSGRARARWRREITAFRRAAHPA
jgi:hypothetical protein